MGGLIAGLIFSYFLSFSTMFICFYALAVKFKIGLNQWGIFRLLGAGLLALLFTSPFVSLVMIHTLLCICLSLIIHIFLATYLTTYSLTTLARPRNLLLLFKHRVASNMHPIVFSFLLALFGLVVTFFIIAFLFVQD